MKVICIKKIGEYKAITIGKTYTIRKTYTEVFSNYDGPYYSIINDEGCSSPYPSEMFKLVSEMRNDKLGEIGI